MKKTACLVDGGYVEKATLECFGRRRFNFEDLIMNVNADGTLSHALYYDCPPYISSPPTAEELEHRRRRESFYNFLRYIGFECIFGKLKKCFDSNGKISFKQKQVDNLITVDLIKLSVKGLITDVKLLTGDADMVPAVKAAQDEGVRVELFYFPYSTSYELLGTVDATTVITSEWMR